MEVKKIYTQSLFSIFIFNYSIQIHLRILSDYTFIKGVKKNLLKIYKMKRRQFIKQYTFGLQYSTKKNLLLIIIFM